MRTIGDRIEDVVAYSFGITLLLGWLILIVTTILKWLLPKYDDKFEKFLQKFSLPFGVLQKYLLIGLLTLLVVRWLTGF